MCDRVASVPVDRIPRRVVRMGLSGKSLIGSIFVKIVLWILFPVLMIWVAGLVEKLFGRVLLRCFFRRQKGR